MGGMVVLVLVLALLEACEAGVRPTVFISADVAHGGATADGVTTSGFVTYAFHLSEAPGGTAACTGTPSYASETGQMTAALTLSEDASLEEHFYAGWTIKTTGGGGSGTTTTIATYNPLTRVITTADSLASTDATTTYELTAGSCTDQAAARSTAGSNTGKWKAGMWSNCPAGCDFVGPVVSPEGYRAMVSGPLACDTVGGSGLEITLQCPKNTVATVEKRLTGISIKRQTVQTEATMGAAAGQSFEVRDTVVIGTMAGALALASDVVDDDADAYFAGWKIETEFPKASGTILTYTQSDQSFTVAWDEPTACDTGFNKDQTTCTPVTTAAGTTYVLTADCPAAPKNVPLVTQALDESNPFKYQFVPGSLTTWDAGASALEYARCTVHRSVDGLYSAHVPAGAFTDAGGNPNVASTACRGLTSDVQTDFGDGANAPTAAETAAGTARCNIALPYQVTSDVTAPGVTVTASDDNWMSSTGSTGSLANGDRITFKFVLSEPPIKTKVLDTDGVTLLSGGAFSLPGGAIGDGDLTAGHQCANPKSWGGGLVYYLRCNAIPEGGATTTAAADRTISVAIAVSKFTDLAGNDNTALSAFTVISDHQSPTVVTTAATSSAITSGSMTNADTTFTFTLADATSDQTLVPTSITQAQYPYGITVPEAWTAQKTLAGVMVDGVGSTNCNPGTFTVGANSNLGPTLLCPVLSSGGDTWGKAELAVSEMDVAARTITLAAQETTIAGGGACAGSQTLGAECNTFTHNDLSNGCQSDPGCTWTPGNAAGQTLQIIARYETGTLAAAGTGDSGAATVTLPTNFDTPNEAAGGGSGTTSTANDYYVGWTIETELPTGKGVVTDYHGANKVATIEWESIVTDVGGTTTYKLTAPCSAAPLYTNLIVESAAASPGPPAVDDAVITFREGFAPTARQADSTGIDNAGAAGAVAGGEDAGVHGADTNANFAIECALMRPGNRELSVYVPADRFSDAAGNPNLASEPFLITQDQVLPTVAITVFEADGVTQLSSNDNTGSRAAIFKIKASEHILSVATSGVNGMVVGDLTVSGCTGSKFWGWKDTFYLRCPWSNGVTASVELADNAVKDLAGNTQSPAVAAVTVVFT